MKNIPLGIVSGGTPATGKIIIMQTEINHLMKSCQL